MWLVELLLSRVTMWHGILVSAILLTVQLLMVVIKAKRNAKDLNSDLRDNPAGIIGWL